MAEIVLWVDSLLGLVALGSLLWFLNTGRMKRSRLWTVVVTPLASIIGSGFLVVAPVMYGDFGSWALPLVMGLNLFALAIGAGLRVNIAKFDPRQDEWGRRHRWLVAVERASNWILGGCYVVAVAFYASLLSAFVFELIGVGRQDEWLGLPGWVWINGLSSAVLLFVGFYGFGKGLHALEKMEKIAVNLKMAVIAGLLAVLVAYFGFSVKGMTVTDYGWRWQELSWHSLAILGGLLLITQGFETVKFMGDDYPVRLRNRAMLVAQLLAAAVYVLFVPLAGPVSAAVGEISETAIIEAMGITAVGVGLVLSLAAVFSQFGAVVADTIGAGGLLEEESKRRLNERQSYVPIVIGAVLLVWLFPIFKIIALASRFFAAYYMAQMVIASYVSWQEGDRWRAGLFGVLALVLGLIVVFAIPAH